MPEAQQSPSVAPPLDPWVVIKLKIPRQWRDWLDEAARARGLSRAALVRQCIRDLMITRRQA